ncbi:hypothetical protein BJ508DRAFT_417949 [Ascobolus immersus RN42]|uniref:LYR motif-containing protein Cup1-like N-terminal domain-containing protein n=1 Tax=Ascobolus immersus RN42 TaxID=1160509 RepID=A0A3N4I1K9_ASCIM|nr:hypothetical protein BJ508DRAFT_417949 [Ascobolus immersus RN42]
MTVRSNSSRRPLPRIAHQQRLSLPLPAKSAQLLRTVSLHLYRGLLREASYLYDDVSRAYITQYIRQRFRKSKEEDKPFRYMTHIRAAKYGLNTLARANAGDIERLYKVLQLGWGRIGPRRHWAWDRLMEYPTTEPLKPLVPGVSRTIPPPTTKNPALKAVLEAWTRGPIKIRRLEPKLPEETVLLKPLSRRRRNNILWKNHTSVLDKTFPPISRTAFQLLEDLAAGRATGVGPKRGERIIRDGEVVGVRPLPESADVHIVTGRVKRRLYEKLIKECCWLAFDPEKNTWKAGRKINGIRKKVVGWSGFFEEVDPEVKKEFPLKKWDEKEAEWDRWLGETPVPRTQIDISKDQKSMSQNYARFEPKEKAQSQEPAQYSPQSQVRPPQQSQAMQKSQSRQPRQQDRSQQPRKAPTIGQASTKPSSTKPNYNAGLISRGKAAERRGKDRGE